MFWFFAFAFISETIATTVGFGASTILLPFALFFFDFPTALTLVGFFHFFGSLGRAGFFHSSLNKKVLLYFGIASIIFSFLGARLTSFVPQTTLKGVLGLFLIVYGGISYANNHFKIKLNLLTLVSGGAISGFLAGLIGTGGALRATFLSAFKKEKLTYLATTAALSLAVDLTRLPVYLAEGFLPKNLYYTLPILFVVAISATYVGKKIAVLLPTKLFEKIVLLAIIAVGLWFSYTSFLGKPPL